MITKLFSYILSLLFYLFFGIFLLLFDPIQRICLRAFGYNAHKKSVGLFNFLIMRSLHVLGTNIVFNHTESLPVGKPVIIVANHQSMWDIPPLIWFLRKLHPKFISKKELGKGIPTVSYNLKYGGSVLIDRKDSRQATAEIEKIAHYISHNNRSVVIFPEGTRSRDGQPKPFKRRGLEILFTEANDAYVLPVSIQNSWKLQRYGMFPIPLGTKIIFDVHTTLKISDFEMNELIDTVEAQITSHVLRYQKR
ncbi:MAG TPA: lysophospholipid acyltransferase family protein [Flavobacteriaceae bacterium]|nr:lysophospholipid acyltransferase family protein [Flavobacteriaceae bacterium]